MSRSLILPRDSSRARGADFQVGGGGEEGANANARENFTFKSSEMAINASKTASGIMNL